MHDIVGTIRLGTDTEISDPSFSWTDWKKLSVPTEEGVYSCSIETDSAGNIRSIEVIKEDAGITEDDWWKSLKMGFVSSRSGLCGFFRRRPDGPGRQSFSHADRIEKRSDVYLAPAGNGDAFYTVSGKNGSYLVRGCRRKGRYYALRLILADA